MKRLKLWFAAALLSAAPLALADPPAQVGRLNFLQGTVSFAPAEANTDWAVAPLNRPVTTGDRLWADRDGRAEFRVGPNAMRIAAMTSLDVLRLDDEVTHLRLAQGTLLVRLRRLDAGDSFEISTPSGAVLPTRPGLYRITVDASGMPTTVLVREGQADVLTGNAPLSLNANQYVTLSTSDPAFGTAPGADEFERWAYARDNPQQPVAATRYVHPDMTGHEDLDHHGTWQAEPQYGNVWIPTAAALPVGWAPYRYGRWVWVSPWGWTWVDNAPWGFAPYHYGRWVWLGQRWAWAPGPRAARPVYAPALVAFVGGHNWSVSVASGPSVAWVPLGWREPYIPWYRHSPRYVRNVNVTHVTNVTVINQYSNVGNVTRIRYVNRDVPSATTVVARDTFVRARHVHEARIEVPVRTLAAAQVTHAAPVTRPERQSLIATQPGTRLPAAVAAREVIAAREPAPVARLAPEGVAANERRAAREEERPRVRVLQTQQGGRQTRPDATAGDKRQDGAPVLGIAPQGAPSAPGAPGNERKADGIAEKTPTRADTKAGDDKQKKPTVAMPPGERERIIALEKAAADKQATGDAQQKNTTTLPPGERARTTERFAEKAQPRTETKAGDDTQKKPAVAMPPGERERGVERTKALADTKSAGDLQQKLAGERERAKTTLETKAGDTQQKPIVAVPPGDRMRTLADTKADTKAAGEAPRPPVATLAPADAQRLQQQQQEARARARQEKQAQDQKQHQERAEAAQQQQERQAREAREREAQQQQARAVQQKQLQQQEQQRALAGQQQQERAAQQQQLRQQQEQQRVLQQQQQQRALQQQGAHQQQERQAQQAREEQQRLMQQQQAAQQQQERQARGAREEQQRQARAQQQAAQQQHEQQAQLAQQQADQQRRAAERQQRRAQDNPDQPARKPKPQPEQAPPHGR